MRPPAWLVVVLVGAGLGLLFAGISTYDFVQHLDRQVHSLHCSFIPGMSHDDPASGCQVAMMSPYSSIFRAHVWGGIPIALGAMSVFAFIAFYAADLVVTRRKDDAKATLFLVAATALPLLTSFVMLTISLTKLGTTCKLCMGIYVSSALVFTGAVMTWRRARTRGGVGTSRSGTGLEIGVAAEPASTGFFGAMFGLGLAFVALPIVLYLAQAPDNSKFVGTCEALPKPDDTYGVLVDLHRSSAKGAAPALEILDPLCPACKAFEQRLEASGLADKLDRRAVMFPLDNTCNWMITETTHPGACTVSEAVLCAGDRAPEVIRWAFEVQDQLRADTAKDPGAAARWVKQKFPELASCVGSPEARSKLNKSLRWSVANNIHVLTPQLFVDRVKLCDEDVDLGLEFALGIMLDRHAKGTLAPPAGAAPPPPPAHRPEPEAMPAVPHKPRPGPDADHPATSDARPAPDAARAQDSPPAQDPLPAQDPPQATPPTPALPAATDGSGGAR